MKKEESYIIGYLKAYFMPTDWKRTILILLIVVTSLLVIFAFTPILLDIVFDGSVRIAPSKKLRVIS